MLDPWKHTMGVKKKTLKRLWRSWKDGGSQAPYLDTGIYRTINLKFLEDGTRGNEDYFGGVNGGERQERMPWIHSRISYQIPVLLCSGLVSLRYSMTVGLRARQASVKGQIWTSAESWKRIRICGRDRRQSRRRDLCFSLQELKKCKIYKFCRVGVSKTRRGPLDQGLPLIGSRPTDPT